MAANPILHGASAAALDRVLALTPAAETLAAYRRAVWSDAHVDAPLLELCRLRLAQLLGLDVDTLPRTPEAARAGLRDEQVRELSRWPTAAIFDERQRAALAFTEQWLFDPGGMRDEDCARLRASLSEPECAAFTMGLALSEATLRLELSLRPVGPLGARSPSPGPG